VKVQNTMVGVPFSFVEINCSQATGGLFPPWRMAREPRVLAGKLTVHTTLAEVLWFGLECLPKAYVLKAWSPTDSTVRRWWHHWEVRPSGRKLGHWGHTFDGDIGTPAPSFVSQPIR
jgi:hypothetical protein